MPAGLRLEWDAAAWLLKSPLGRCFPRRHGGVRRGGGHDAAAGSAAGGGRGQRRLCATPLAATPHHSPRAAPTVHSSLPPLHAARADPRDSPRPAPRPACPLRPVRGSGADYCRLWCWAADLGATQIYLSGELSTPRTRARVLGANHSCLLLGAAAGGSRALCPVLSEDSAPSACLGPQTELQNASPPSMVRRQHRAGAGRADG